MPGICFSVIIAGGKGTRFWPLSRARKPKQLLKILSRKSLLQETAERVYPLGGPSQTLVVTVADQIEAVRRELPGLPKANFLTEPVGKNTAPCIGLAVLEVLRRNPDAIMVVVPADHWVTGNVKFRRTLKAAIRLAAQHNQLITIGIRPDYPETGYGYIMKGKAVGVKTTGKAFVVKRFTEKPELGLARALLRRGSLWNSGIFVWKAVTLWQILSRYRPEIAKGLHAIERAAGGKSLSRSSPKLEAMIAHEYAKLPSLSIDYAVMEQAASDGKVLTLEADFGWSDIGSWSAVHRLMTHDTDGNAGAGHWFSLGAKNCLVHAPDRLVVLLGVENAVVVDTPDALFVGDLGRSQEVRDLVDALNRKGLASYTV